MIQIQEHKIPALRFPEFSGDWNTEHLEKYISRVGVPVSVEPDTLYREIGIRSHGKGLFHKEPVTGESLGNKRVFHVHIPAFVVNIVFAWEHAIAVTSENEEGFIASHRFPMFVPVENKATLPFVKYFFIRKYGKHLLGLASPGGAGRNKTLGQKDFAKLKVTFPKVDEQQKIASFLSAVDTRIEQLGKKKALLEQYKKGMMQKIFSQELRFKDDHGIDFSDWEEKRLEDVAIIIMGTSPKSESYNNHSEGLPLIQGNADIKDRKSAPRIFTSVVTKECQPNDVLLSVRAPVGEVSISIHHACIGRGISAIRAKQLNNQDFVFQFLLWFEPRWKRISQGSTFESVNTEDIKSLKIPTPHEKEQQKIADFLSFLDKKTFLVAKELEQAQAFNKGLLQQMFI